MTKQVNSWRHAVMITGIGLGLMLLAQGCAKVAAEPIGLTEDEIAIIRVYQLARRIESADYDMRLAVEMAEDESGVDADSWIYAELDDIDARIYALVLTPAVEPLRPHLSKTIKDLRSVTQAVVRGEDARKDAYQRYGESLNAMFAKRGEIRDAVWRASDDQTEDDYLALESASIRDAATREAFLKANEMLESRRFVEALEAARSIQDNVRGEMAEGRVVEIILACHMANGSPVIADYVPYEELFELVSEFLARKVYTPRIGMMFYYWQTLQQYTQGGSSNFSTIDYSRHHQMRDDLIDLAIENTRISPDMAWTRSVPWFMLSVPVIERFPHNYQYGNSVAIHISHLSRLFDDQEDGSANPPADTGERGD